MYFDRAFGVEIKEMNNEYIVHKVWNLCHILRGDGISYHEYISELTYILFLKIAEETGAEDLLGDRYKWHDLFSYEGNNLLGFYQEMLTHYEGNNLLGFYQEMLTHHGNHARNKSVREIYAFPTTVFSHSENLKAVIEGISKIDWHSMSEDGIGKIYESLLAKNSEDARSGAGQYFTPRALVNCMVNLTKPQLGEVIQDPATGTGGFLISAEIYIRSGNDKKSYNVNPPIYQGMEIERGTYRLCHMNIFLHRIEADIILGDALTDDANVMKQADLILANPPFGSKAGSFREGRYDIPFPTTNKQLAFLQHIYLGLKPGGRAAVIMPDNVLFEENTGRKIRIDLMEKCNLHTILRLPTGIFYAQGVKTNVLFFTRERTNAGNTKGVWVYDMRTNMPAFGKRTPLDEKHFESFELAFGNDPYGKFRRKDQGEEGRFRYFTKEDIAKQSDNLDISWLKEEGIDELLPEPEIIVAQIMANLSTAMKEIQILSTILEEDESFVERATYE